MRIQSLEKALRILPVQCGSESTWVALVEQDESESVVRSEPAPASKVRKESGWVNDLRAGTEDE